MIDHMNRTMHKHIVTIEDPIEFLHRDRNSIINQREVGQDTASFKRALRRVLRQDPDVILVGEMRDEETVHTALSAAETGHLVLSTLHTVDASETINRIIDFFPPHQQQQARAMIAGTLKGIVSQRLVRTADGHGRVACCEILVMTGRVHDMILDPKLTGELPEVISEGAYYGMQTFDQHLLSAPAVRPRHLRGRPARRDLAARLQADGRRPCQGRPARRPRPRRRATERRARGARAHRPVRRPAPAAGPAGPAAPPAPAPPAPAPRPPAPSAAVPARRRRSHGPAVPRPRRPRPRQAAAPRPRRGSAPSPPPASSGQRRRARRRRRSRRPPSAVSLPPAPSSVADAARCRRPSVAAGRALSRSAGPWGRP